MIRVVITGVVPFNVRKEFSNEIKITIHAFFEKRADTRYRISELDIKVIFNTNRSKTMAGGKEMEIFVHISNYKRGRSLLIQSRVRNGLLSKAVNFLKFKIPMCKKLIVETAYGNEKPKAIIYK